MTNDEERAALLQRGRECCLEPFERLLEETLRESDFKRAENWYHEYSGRLAPSSSLVQGFALESMVKLLYQISGKMQAPIWTGEEVPPPCPDGYSH